MKFIGVQGKECIMHQGPDKSKSLHFKTVARGQADEWNRMREENTAWYNLIWT